MFVCSHQVAIYLPQPDLTGYQHHWRRHYRKLHRRLTRERRKPTRNHSILVPKLFAKALPGSRLNLHFDGGWNCLQIEIDLMGIVHDDHTVITGIAEQYVGSFAYQFELDALLSEQSDTFNQLLGGRSSHQSFSGPTYACSTVPG